jgi:hypothetical protein
LRHSENETSKAYFAIKLSQAQMAAAQNCRLDKRKQRQGIKCVAGNGKLIITEGTDIFVSACSKIFPSLSSSKSSLEEE